MMGTSWKSVGLATAGFVYGSLLGFLGLIATGAGHGTYVFLGLASSPFGITQKFEVALLAPPFLWCVVGGLLGAVIHRIPRALFLAAIFAHYTALPFILAKGSLFGDWDYLSKVGGFGTVVFGLYGFGQVIIWAVFVLSLQQHGLRFGVKDLLLALAFFVGFVLIPELIVLANFRAQRDKQYDFAIEEPGHSRIVRQLGTETVNDLPKFDDGMGQDYEDLNCAIAPGPSFLWVHPRKVGGELCTWKPQSDGLHRQQIPEPEGFQPKYDFETYFENSAIWVGPQGDRFVRWQIEGNGDHGLALRKNGSETFTTARVRGVYMACSKAISGPDGTWHLLVWHASLPEKFRVSVYSLDSKLQLRLVGEHASPGHHDIGVLDAVFVTNDKLHIVWGSVEPSIAPKVRSNWLRLLSIDLDVQTKVWSDEREIWRLDRFMVCSPKIGPGNMVVVATRPKEGAHHGQATNEGADRAIVA